MVKSSAKPNVWQVSGGPENRSYVDIFLKHGVALIGPGDTGPWRADRDDKEFDGSFVRRFACEVKPDDIVVLRTGISKIHAVGIVASDYIYLPQFDDVNGWDLQHGHRVRWYQLPVEHDFGSSVFGGNPPRISKIAQPDIIDFASRFIQSEPKLWQNAALPPIPQEEPPLKEIPPAFRNIVAQVQDLTGLYQDQTHFGEAPSEDELVAHYVVPFLRALGWPVEKIAIKWRLIDVAVFHALPRTPDNCAFIIEAKRLGYGVEGALTQAKQYLQTLNIDRDIVVTDGVRYRMYEAKSNYAPSGYANLSKLKQQALILFQQLQKH